MTTSNSEARKRIEAALKEKGYGRGSEVASVVVEALEDEGWTITPPTEREAYSADLRNGE
jgi:hypothetical protein